MKAILKKAVIILGSPRKNGNSGTLAKRAIAGMLSVGGSYEAFYLNGLNISPCQACEYCRRNDTEQCAIKDDMSLIYSKIKEADALLLASPIYMFSVSAQLKLFMDRCYAIPRSLEGKRVGILLTYGDVDEYASGAINAINTLKDEYNYKQAEIIGILHGSANDKGEIASNTRLMDQAYQLGKALVE